MKDGIIRPDYVTGEPYGTEVAGAPEENRRFDLRYFNEILDRAEAEPADDLLSRFLAVEVEGDRLSREDILDICFLFLIAGLDTVTSSLDCMFAYLAQHPEQRHRLVADPELIPGHRGDAAVGDAGHGGGPGGRAGDRDRRVPHQAGEGVMVMLGSANTDEAALTTPTRCASTAE